MSYELIRQQIDRLVDRAIASERVDTQDAYQAVIDAGAAFNLKLAELQDTLDGFEAGSIYYECLECDEDECDE